MFITETKSPPFPGKKTHRVVEQARRYEVHAQPRDLTQDIAHNISTGKLKHIAHSVSIKEEQSDEEEEERR